MVKSTGKRAPKADKRVLAVLRLLVDPKHTATVRELARSAEVPYAEFSDLFLETTGTTPEAFLGILKGYRRELDFAVDILSNASSAR